ncbi:efflux RND transporter periplasmic adaptor subunit [Desulforhopalus singaporensis]|uniref:HlyD family secretion protein n=1 Tax=Desulforhopalus singaporensis TaxID=91360 RepID=A0A1H0M4N3_9BACT|nr:efflux RND transporter periplasmic adaptor subunit [Desulforhopalus singaporensis]SDO75383.1 HlyD family secretion protein [Desulforhopalus singaporensis]
MKKPMVVVVVILVVAAAVIFGRKWYRRDSEGQPGHMLKIYGTVDIRDASLAFKEQERITEVLVEEGDRVESGQVLARLKSDLVMAAIREAQGRIGEQEQVVKRLAAGSRPQEIAQARAEVEAARVQVANNLKVLRRLEKTSGSGASSKLDLDEARSRFEVERALLKVKQKALDLVIEGPRAEDRAAADYRLAAARAGLAQLQVRLADMTLTAPASGTIESRILEPGEMAGPGQPVLILALTDPKWVRAYVSEPDLGRIRTGMTARVISDSFPEQPVQAVVGFISPVAEFTPRTVQTEELRTKLVYETRVVVADPDNRLRLGMPVTVVVDEEPRPQKGASSPLRQDSTAGREVLREK